MHIRFCPAATYLGRQSERILPFCLCLPLTCNFFFTQHHSFSDATLVNRFRLKCRIDPVKVGKTTALVRVSPKPRRNSSPKIPIQTQLQPSLPPSDNHNHPSLPPTEDTMVISLNTCHKTRPSHRVSALKTERWIPWNLRESSIFSTGTCHACSS